MTLAIESRFRGARFSVHLDNFAALTELSERAVGDHGSHLGINLTPGGKANSNGVVSACRRTLLIEQRNLTLLIEQRNLERVLINRPAMSAFG